MRVAVSGTHGSGKSTLIDAFLVTHDDYVAEAEAYEALQDFYGETFAAEPSADDFFHQLDYHVGRLREYGAGDRVVFERSPADYVAYLLALDDLGRETSDTQLAERSIEVAREAVTLLDLIVLLPDEGAGVPDSEDPRLGRAVAARLDSILIDDEFEMFRRSGPRVVEAGGSTAQRLRTLEAALR